MVTLNVYPLAVYMLISAIAIGTLFCYALFFLRIFHPYGDIAGEGLQIWIYGLLAIGQRWFFIMSALTTCVRQDLHFNVLIFTLIIVH